MQHQRSRTAGAFAVPWLRRHTQRRTSSQADATYAAVLSTARTRKSPHSHAAAHVNGVAVRGSLSRDNRAESLARKVLETISSRYDHDDLRSRAASRRRIAEGVTPRLRFARLWRICDARGRPQACGFQSHPMSAGNQVVRGVCQIRDFSRIVTGPPGREPQSQRSIGHQRSASLRLDYDDLADAMVLVVSRPLRSFTEVAAPIGLAPSSRGCHRLRMNQLRDKLLLNFYIRWHIADTLSLMSRPRPPRRLTRSWPSNRVRQRP
jgi:hypothetical protein